MKVLPLRQLNLKAWTPELVSLFNEMKNEVTSSPVLARYDSNKPTFLKTDYSALGMAYIIMQPENSAAALKTIKLLESDGDCKFDTSFDGPRLKPICFGSRKCSLTESNYQSFVGEIATGRWAMAENKVYLLRSKVFLVM